MNVIIFTGPTIAPAEVRELIDAVCLPPVAQGDLYQACLQNPRAIGIIDGYFERLPSVWHKEILWAMRQGIHVFGSASMGALRATELEAFGMIGVGAVFEAYRDGVLEDDDEVAVAHGAAEDGYRTLSEAMVNIRATLARAQADSVVCESTCAALQKIAKELFYPERSYRRILELGADAGPAAEEIESFRRWVRDGAVNQKRDDARAMLRTMGEFLAADPEPKQVSYDFQESLWWDRLRQSPEADSQAADHASLLEQLARDPQTLGRVRAAALGWWLACEQARRQGRPVEAFAVLAESAQFCRTHNLASEDDVARWLSENRCSRANLDRLFELRALAARAESLSGPALDECVLAYLRWTGEYPVLLNRGRATSP